MWFRRSWRCGVLLLCLRLSGCFPDNETPVEEQKNPYFITGKSRVTARDYKGAIEAFEKAVEVNPRSALAHFELGLLYEQQENDYPAAIYHYNQAIKLRPNGAHPADNARIRIPGCRQEMIKTDLLATVNPAALRESERLRDDNQLLRKQVESLSEALKQARAQLAARPPEPVTHPSGTPNPNSTSGSRATADGSHLREANVPPGRGLTPLPPRGSPTSTRSHTVKPRETLASIARLYKVSLDSLIAANPSLEPKRMKAGQTINIPAS